MGDDNRELAEQLLREAADRLAELHLNAHWSPQAYLEAMDWLQPLLAEYKRCGTAWLCAWLRGLWQGDTSLRHYPPDADGTQVHRDPSTKVPPWRPELDDFLATQGIAPQCFWADPANCAPAVRGLHPQDEACLFHGLGATADLVTDHGELSEQLGDRQNRILNRFPIEQSLSEREVGYVRQALRTCTWLSAEPPSAYLAGGGAEFEVVPLTGSGRPWDYVRLPSGSHTMEYGGLRALLAGDGAGARACFTAAWNLSRAEQLGEEVPSRLLWMAAHTETLAQHLADLAASGLLERIRRMDRAVFEVYSEDEGITDEED
jgi:hypothetical protein